MTSMTIRKLLAACIASLSMIAVATPTFAQATTHRHHHRHHRHHIPQHNGGDHDADNNGGPSDGDGNT
jgi:hypothetical protein